MNYDARVTLYGGAVISLSLYGFGALTNPVIGLTGIALIGPILFMSALFDRILPA